MHLLAIITILFVIYCSSESIANIARHAGARTTFFPLGLMLSNQIYSINRLNGFLIAPLLGLYVDTGGNEAHLKGAAIIGCVASALLLLIFLQIWPIFLANFSQILQNMKSGGFSIKLFNGISRKVDRKIHRFSSKRYDGALIFAQSICTSLAMPTAFILNILALRYPDYKATLVQSATVISGIGNLILNFYISPRIALAETQGDPDGEYFSAMVGKIFGIGVIASCAIAIL
ncbi:lipid II flippase family protein [Tsuneonella suprasediminis]|uniref:lipid II flippase family protein n=1 Tax=Tsuneonella suprasediminis TaxID=2306996 RepID=UPI002F93326A